MIRKHMQKTVACAHMQIIPQCYLLLRYTKLSLERVKQWHVDIEGNHRALCTQ